MISVMRRQLCQQQRVSDFPPGNFFSPTPLLDRHTCLRGSSQARIDRKSCFSSEWDFEYEIRLGSDVDLFFPLSPHELALQIQCMQTIKINIEYSNTRKKNGDCRTLLLQLLGDTPSELHQIDGGLHCTQPHQTSLCDVKDCESGWEDEMGTGDGGDQGSFGPLLKNSPYGLIHQHILCSRISIYFIMENSLSWPFIKGEQKESNHCRQPQGLTPIQPGQVQTWPLQDPWPCICKQGLQTNWGCICEYCCGCWKVAMPGCSGCFPQSSIVLKIAQTSSGVESPVQAGLAMQITSYSCWQVQGMVIFTDWSRSSKNLHSCWKFSFPLRSLSYCLNSSPMYYFNAQDWFESLILILNIILASILFKISSPLFRDSLFYFYHLF